jgi:hypothetical protein
MEFDNNIKRKILIDDIPALVFTPKNTSKFHPTIILYHGWGSSAEKQEFRGYILSTFGYQVIIPCAIYHGERNPIDHENLENAGRYFWDIIFKNVEESSLLIDYAIKNLNADPDRFGVCGNSMGGFTSAGVFTSHPDIKAMVVFNGSCNWNCSNELFGLALNITDFSIPKDAQDKIDKYNPMSNLEHIINRPILMLHGDSDTVVDINAQREFYKEAAPKYEDSQRLKFVEYPKLNHFVTTNMMEEAISWCNKFI